LQREGSLGPRPSIILLPRGPIDPNFTPAEDVRVRGRITDQTTAPFQNSPIELRRFICERKQVTVKKVLNRC
jgi:hypothetical protein